MAVRLIHRAGDTFAVDCQAFLDLEQTQPRNLTDTTITASADAPMQEPIEFDVAVNADPTTGRFQLRASAATTEGWPPGIWYGRISYEEDGTKASTEVWQLEIVSDYNVADT